MAFDIPLLSGLLVCDKPIGVTSRDCINVIERILRDKFPKPHRLPKVGHAGTLDPLATGVLVIGIGGGVRLVPYIQAMSKTYDATFRLGLASESGDLETELHVFEGAPVPSLEQLLSAAEHLTGSIQQTPPSTSAIKVNGKKAYKYAHRGKDVIIPPRIVQVDSIHINRYDYPDVDLTIQCGSGTYIRTLGMDIAIACGTRGVMTRLVRTSIGEFTIAKAVTLKMIQAEGIEPFLLPMALGVSKLPQLQITSEQMESLIHGVKLDASDLPQPVSGDYECDDEASVIDSDGELRGIVQLRSGKWCPYRIFHRN